MTFFIPQVTTLRLSGFWSPSHKLHCIPSPCTAGWEGCGQWPGEQSVLELSWWPWVLSGLGCGEAGLGHTLRSPEDMSMAPKASCWHLLWHLRLMWPVDWPLSASSRPCGALWMLGPPLASQCLLSSSPRVSTMSKSIPAAGWPCLVSWGPLGVSPSFQHTYFSCLSPIRATGEPQVTEGCQLRPSSSSGHVPSLTLFSCLVPTSSRTRQSGLFCLPLLDWQTAGTHNSATKSLVHKILWPSLPVLPLALLNRNWNSFEHFHLHTDCPPSLHPSLSFCCSDTTQQPALNP